LPTTYDDLINRLACQHQGEVEAAKIELTMWTMVKGPQRAEACTRRHPVGLEAGRQDRRRDGLGAGVRAAARRDAARIGRGSSAQRAAR